MTKAVKLIFPIIKALPNCCAVACLQMATYKFSKKRLFESEFKNLAKKAKKDGLSTEEMCSFLKKLNIDYEIINNGSFKDVETAIDNGFVPIAMTFNVMMNGVGGNHSVIIKGYDSNSYYIVSPGKSKVRKLKKDEFDTVWFEITDNHLIVYKHNLLIIKGFKE